MSFVSTLSRFISAASNFSSSKSYQRRGVRRAEREYMDKNLVPHHPLNNIELLIISIINSIKISIKYRFNGFFSWNNLLPIKDGAYLINLDDRNSKETHWVSLFIDRNTAVYFDSFGIEYIPLEVSLEFRLMKKLIKQEIIS